jgi:hypothetical protein
MPCLALPDLGPGRGSGEERPWSLDARRSNGLSLLFLGLGYQARPDDPIWTEQPVKDSLTCRVNLLRTQVVGPIGWGDGAIGLDVMVGGAEEAAGRLLAPLTGIELSGTRFRDAWRRLVDPATGVVGRYPDATAIGRAEATARVAVLVALLEG